MDKKERTKKPMKKGAKWALVIFIWGFSAYFLVALSGFIAATVSAKDAKSVWADWQNEYIALLEQRYAADENFSKVNDEDFLTRTDMAEVLGAKLNEIRYIASHNSYKTGLTPETKYFYHGPLAAIMGKQYDYIFDTITEQLNAGIRSIELDANKVKTADGFRIECLHSDMLETNSTMIDFDKGLKEIRMWMDRNENALPIIVLVEPKGGKKFDLEAFDKFDEMLFENFGEKLVTPKKLLDAAGVSDFDEFRAKNAYPTVESLKGKIIFLLHEKDSLETYMQRDPDMQKSAMNIALDYATVQKKGKDYSRFSFTVILNDPTKHKDRISEAINRDNFGQNEAGQIRRRERPLVQKRNRVRREYFKHRLHPARQGKNNGISDEREVDGYLLRNIVRGGQNGNLARQITKTKRSATAVFSCVRDVVS